MLTSTRLWTAVVTPLDQDGQLDLKSFEGLLRDQERAGNGIVILGSTGEALNLSASERQEVLDFTDSLALSSPVMVGIGGHHLDTTLEWLETLESKQNIHAYLVVTPLYAKPGAQGQYHWFKSILDRATRPCMLYNVPGRTGVPMSPEAINRLNQHPQFWAIKEASGDVEKFCHYRDQTRGQQLFSGDDALTPVFAPHGCFGLVSVSANVWPEATKLYVELAVAGELDQEEKELWEKSAQALFCASNPIPTKALLFSQGRLNSAHLKPPLHLEDLADMAPLHQADKDIARWYQWRMEKHNDPITPRREGLQHA